MLQPEEARRFITTMREAWIAAGRPPIRVSSWLRDDAANTRVGGQPDSQHLIGTGVDVTGQTGRLNSEARSRGIVVLDRGSHVHYQQFRKGVARTLGLFDV